MSYALIQEMVALATLLSQKESLTYRDIEACLGPRPFAPNAQLSAYVDALPTRETLQLPSTTRGKLHDEGSDPSGVGANSLDGTVGTKKVDEQLHRESTKNNEDGSAKDRPVSVDSDDDEDDDDNENGNTGGRGGGNSGDETRHRPRKKKLFGGDDDSCLPELLRKPVTPQPASAASSATTSVAAGTTGTGL